jgi:hypothetical protein
MSATLSNLGNVERRLGQLSAVRASRGRALAIEEMAYSGSPEVAVRPLLVVDGERRAAPQTRGARST